MNLPSSPSGRRTSGRRTDEFSPSGTDLVVLPLGGCGEVGMNATLFIYGEDALLVDCGALLGVPHAPGVERAVPGFEAVFAPGRRLVGIVLTHGHEDHIGALGALWAQADVPVFGTPVTLDTVRSRLENPSWAPPEARAQAERLIEVPLGGHITLGPFSVEFVRVTHSIPESAALVIETPAGRVLHSGDFKLDPEPADGEPTDLARLREVGTSGVDLLLSDSTNSEQPGRTTPEQAVAGTLDRLIGECEGRVVATLFASHLHRLRGLVAAAQKHGRSVVLAGRALERIWPIGVKNGVLPEPADVVVPIERLGHLRRNRTLVLATGSQGEWQGGMHRVAHGKDAALRCIPGDRVIFSSRTIPGNGPTVRRLVNMLLSQGIEVIHDRMEPVHCSGHAHAEEQAEFLGLVRPRHFVPIHGDRAMLEAHAKTAAATDVALDRITILENGQSAVLSKGRVYPGPEEVVSRRAVDRGGRMMDWGDVRDRNRIGRTGLVVCSLVLDERGRLRSEPVITTRGRTDPAALWSDVKQELARVLDDSRAEDDGWCRDTCQSAVRRAVHQAASTRPEVEIHVVRESRLVR